MRGRALGSARNGALGFEVVRCRARWGAAHKAAAL